MKFKVGDTIISGPYLIKVDGSAGTPNDRIKTEKLAQISLERGTHMILGKVVAASKLGIHVEARYLMWNSAVEEVGDYNLHGKTFLPVDSVDYGLTELLDREKDDVDNMVTYLQYDGQSAWIAEHQPEEQI